MPKRGWTQAFGQDAIVIPDPRNAYYGLITRIDEAVGSDGGEEFHIRFDSALVSFYQDLVVRPDPRSIAALADTRLLVLTIPAAQLDAFNFQMAAAGRPVLTEGTWWLLLPSQHNLRGSLRLAVYRPPAGATDPRRIIDDNARDEEMYIRPFLLTPLLSFTLDQYARS
jgi:hypothetical protein